VTTTLGRPRLTTAAQNSTLKQLSNHYHNSPTSGGEGVQEVVYNFSPSSSYLQFFAMLQLISNRDVALSSIRALLDQIWVPTTLDLAPPHPLTVVATW